MSETAPNGSALIAVARFKFFVANTLGVLKRTAADGCAEDVAYPVSAFSAVQATALGAASAYEFIFAFGTASTGRLCRQVRVLLAKEPFKVRKPSQLGWSVETPRPALAVCCLSRVAIGSVETEEAPLHL